VKSTPRWGKHNLSPKCGQPIDEVNLTLSTTKLPISLVQYIPIPKTEEYFEETFRQNEHHYAIKDSMRNRLHIIPILHHIQLETLLQMETALVKHSIQDLCIYRILYLKDRMILLSRICTTYTAYGFWRDTQRCISTSDIITGKIRMTIIVVNLLQAIQCTLVCVHLWDRFPLHQYRYHCAEFCDSISYHWHCFQNSKTIKFSNNTCNKQRFVMFSLFSKQQTLRCFSQMLIIKWTAVQITFLVKRLVTSFLPPKNGTILEHVGSPME
jgi:hypothetical protein